MRFAIYSRKSVSTGRGESVENQVEMCRQYIFGKFPQSVDADIEVYEDEGFSAKNTDRPRFKELLFNLRQGRFGCVVCYRLDRISRSVGDFSALIEEMNARHVNFVCIKEEFDTSRPMGKAMMYIASVFAQLERETIAERVRDNMLMLARSGRWLGGTPPTGFCSEQTREVIIDGGVKTAFRLKTNPAETGTVREIFGAFLRMGSVSAVARHLSGAGVKSRMGKPFSLPGIKEILQNPVYCTADAHALGYFTELGADICFGAEDCGKGLGLLAYNKRDYRQKHAPRRPVERWIIAVGRHKGVIDGQSWAQAQRLLRGKKTEARARNTYALLSGLIYCGRCGQKMHAKARSNSDTLFDYICANKAGAGKAACNCPNLGGVRADALVCQRLEPYSHAGEGIINQLEGIKKSELALARRAGTPDTAAPDAVPELQSLLRGFEALELDEKRTLIGLLTRCIEWDGKGLRIQLGGG